MKLSVSNLAFTPTAAGDEWERLAAAGVSGVEVAPTRLGPWAELDAARLRAFRTELEGRGLRASSLQAIFFGVDGLALLGSVEAFHAMEVQIARVARIAAELGAEVAVFGAPRQRARGTLPSEDAFALGADRLSRLAHLAGEEGLVIGLEPVPADYGNDFLPGWRDVLAMVQAVDHAGLRVHLDTSCVALGGDDIAEAVKACAPWLAHYHAAEPKLGPFAAPAAPHAAAAAALAAVGYPGWVAIEMLEQPAHPLAALLDAVRYVRGTYAC